MATTKTVPQNKSFTRMDVSRSGSEGPGFMPGGMSRSARRRGRRSEAWAPITAITRTTPEAIPIRIALPVESAASRVTGDIPPAPAFGLIASCHTEGTLGRLVDGVGAPGRAGRRGARVHLDLAALDRDGEALESVGGRPQLVLAGIVVLGPVAGALEPLDRRAEGDPAPQVGALLVQGHQLAAGDFGGEAGGDGSALVPVAG